MSNRNEYLTAYPEVNAVLDELVPEVQSILADQFIGMYVYGSMASGGFDRDSDVDYVVVTAGELPEALITKLQAMHTRIATIDSWCATQLEGSYIPMKALRNFDPLHALHLHIDRGRGEQLQRMQIDDDRLSHAWWGGWVLLRATLREKGITLAGPGPATLIDPVSPAELKQANLAILHGWAEQILEQPSLMKDRGYQSYIVLTLCRILYTLEFGSTTSKPVAAHWAQATLRQPWVDLIERAWIGRHNPVTEISPADVYGTLDFIRFTMDRNRQLGMADIVELK